jgi:hypothetical protein
MDEKRANAQARLFLTDLHVVVPTEPLPPPLAGRQGVSLAISAWREQRWARSADDDVQSIVSIVKETSGALQRGLNRLLALFGQMIEHTLLPPAS